MNAPADVNRVWSDTVYVYVGETDPGTPYSEYEDSIIALDRATGEVHWVYPTAERGSASFPITGSGDTIYMDDDDGLVALREADEQWEGSPDDDEQDDEEDDQEEDDTEDPDEDETADC